MYLLDNVTNINDKLITLYLLTYTLSTITYSDLSVLSKMYQMAQSKKPVVVHYRLQYLRTLF